MPASLQRRMQLPANSAIIGNVMIKSANGLADSIILNTEKSTIDTIVTIANRSLLSLPFRQNKELSSGNVISRENRLVDTKCWCRDILQL